MLKIKKLIKPEIQKSNDLKLVFFKSNQFTCKNCQEQMKSKKDFLDHIESCEEDQELMLTSRQEKATRHSNKLGARVKKRKKLHGKEKVEVVMHEFKHGKLHSGSGEIVKNRKQAIAIAMSEAGLSNKSKEIKLVFFKRELMPHEKSAHKYLRKEGDKYIYEDGKEKNPEIKKPSSIGLLKLKGDGYYYDGQTKITDNPNKAKAYADKKGGSNSNTAGQNKPNVGHTVRIKSTSKNPGKGIIATITEINNKDNTARLKDESGKFYRVKLDALEMTKSKRVWLSDFSLLKSEESRLVFFKSKLNHKYIRIENGKYIYKENNNFENKDTEQQEKKDLRNENKNVFIPNDDRIDWYKNELKNIEENTKDKKELLKDKRYLKLKDSLKKYIKKVQKFNKLNKSLVFKKDKVLLLLKSQGHKYIKRTGSPGSYRYFYRDTTGQISTLNSGKVMKKIGNSKWEEVKKKDLPNTKIDFRDITDKQIKLLQKDKFLRNKFISENQNMVGGTISKLLRNINYGLEKEDAIQNANLKFIEIISNWNPTKFKHKLETQKEELTKKISKYKRELKTKKLKKKEKENKQNAIDLLQEQLNKKQNIKSTSGGFLTYVQTSIVNDFFQRYNEEKGFAGKNRQVKDKVSIDETIGTDKEGNELTVGDTIKDTAENSQKEKEQIESYKETLNKIKEDDNDPTRKKIINLILNYPKIKDQVQIAKRLKLTEGAVSTAFRKIREKAQKFIIKSEILFGFIEWLNKF